jgi:hypothetical protein
MQIMQSHLNANFQLQQFPIGLAIQAIPIQCLCSGELPVISIFSINISIDHFLCRPVNIINIDSTA